MFPICEIRIRDLLSGYPEWREREGRIFGVSDPEEPEDHSLIFVKSVLAEDACNVKECIFVTGKDTDLTLDPSCVQLKCEYPKNLYGELLERLKTLLPYTEQYMEGGSIFSKDIQIGEDVQIGPFCVVGRDVVIGDGCRIGAGTVIGDHVRIGRDVQIREKCLIGVEDADIYRTEDGACRTLPHLAGTVIEDGCLLLAGSVLAAGDTRTTVLGRGSMIGLLGDVGHNCRIGEETLVSGKASISGHCRIGDQVYVAPMAVTTNRIQVGDHAYLGLGAVAIKDVPEGEKQFGNPARKVLEIKKK